MKLDRIVVDNVLGLQHVDLQITTPITLVAGHNGAGKTSLQQAVRLALRGELSRVKLKKELDLLVHDGAKKGATAVTCDGTEYRYDLPAGKGSHVVDCPALPYVLDPPLFARTDAQERRRFLFDLAGIKVSPEEVRRRLLAAECDAKKIETVLPLLRAGFPEACKDAASRATEAKGAWRAVTGETYGEKKADGWKAVVPTHDAMALVEARADLSRIESELDAANKQLGRLDEQEAQAEKNKQRIVFLQRHVDDLDRHADLVMRAQRDLDEFRPKFEAALQAAHPAHPLTCPHCAGAVMLDDNLGLIAYEAPAPLDDDGAASVDEYEKSLGVLERTLANRQRDLEQSKNAKTELEGLHADATAVDAAMVQRAIDSAEALKARRDEIRANIAAMESAAIAAKSAEANTEKAASAHRDVLAWSAIAAALAPDGIPGALLAEALTPFNQRLQQSSIDTGWHNVSITADMEIIAGNRPYALLSESEQWRCDAMIAEAIAFASGLRLLMLDRFDVLDQAGRGQAMDWLLVLACEGEIDTALLFGTLKALPSSLPDEINGHWLQGGRITTNERAAA